MPQDTTQLPQMQAPQMPPQGMQQTPSHAPQGNAPQGNMDPEKMLIQMLKEMEQNIMDLSQRVDVLEQKEQTQM